MSTKDPLIPASPGMGLQANTAIPGFLHMNSGRRSCVAGLYPLRSRLNPVDLILEVSGGYGAGQLLQV